MSSSRGRPRLSCLAPSDACVGLEGHGSTPSSRSGPSSCPESVYSTRVGVYWPKVVRTARGPPPTCSTPDPPPVAPRPRAVHAEHHRSIDERPRPLGLRRASDLRSARPASVSDVVTPESSSSHEQHMMLRCRKAEGPADLHDRRGLPVMRCSDRCGPQRLVASRSRISVSSSTSVTSLASSAAFCLARRSLSLFIGRTMAK